MIKLNPLDLDPLPASFLRRWQREIDSMSSYAERVQVGKDKFKSRNHNRNATFNHVREVLGKMCQGARRCAYCEDSVADEIEHIQPKDIYPNLVFSWDNYLYACGPCNGPKNNQFSVLAGREPRLVNVTRAKDEPVVPPVKGVPVLINPRAEDPLHFLFLDLLNTFAFTPRTGISPVDAIRADYTIGVLRLNDRDYLVNARRTAFGNYRARLVEYINEKTSGASQNDLRRRQSELLKVGHQTVWREMQRQQASYPALAALFAAAPEALVW